MKLKFAGEIERDAKDSAFWWMCMNVDNCIQADRYIEIPAPEYNWPYWHEGIPQEDLKEDLELKAEYQEALQLYLNRPMARK